MTPFYTRTGDNGTTGVLNKDRLPKHHPRIEALGAVDEATAALGLARALCQAPQIATILIEIQRDLYCLMTELVATPNHIKSFHTINLHRVQWLETQMDSFSISVNIPDEFLLPGDSSGEASLALARTIVRRAERCVSKLFEQGDINNASILQYLNRLSSLCFVLELYENHHTGRKTTFVKK